MTVRLRTLVCAATLVAIALALIAARNSGTQTPRNSATSDAYDIHLSYQVTTADPDFELLVYLPRDSTTKSVFAQTVVHTGLRVHRSGNTPGSRDLEVSLRSDNRNNEHTLEIELGVLRKHGGTDKRYRVRQLSDEWKARYLTLDFNDPDAERYRFLLGHRRHHEPDQQAVFERAAEAISRIDAWEKMLDDDDRRRAFMWYCRTRGVPAREVVGLKLDDDGARGFHRWVEANINDQWRIWDLTELGQASEPDDYLPFNRIGDSPIESDGEGQVEADVSFVRMATPHWLNDEQSDWRGAFDFFQLSLERRQAISLLLMLPFGVLLTVLMRTSLGLSTYGTFGPTLLALGFLTSDAIVFSIITAVVIVFSVLGRALLMWLSLPRIPRVSIVFSLVVITLSFSITAMNWLGLDANHADTFLPLAVLTVLVDQIMRTWQKKGTTTAALRLLRTVLLALLIALLLNQQWLAEIVVRIPELHLITMAAILLAGTFRLMKSPESAVAPPAGDDG